MAVIRSLFEKPLHHLLNPLVTIAARAGIRPNTISTIGFTVNLVAAALLFAGQFVLGGILIWLAGILDMLDGKVARHTGQVSIYGAIYDATLDRISEIALYTGLGSYFIIHGRYLTALVVVVATTGSVLISYVRARAESYDIPCSVGILCKGERIFLLGLGLVLNFLGHALDRPMHMLMVIIHLPHKFPPMPVAVVVFALAILAPITVIQRLLYIKAAQRPGV